MENGKIRRAEESDLATICRIHNEGIEDRIATLDLELHTLETKTAWFSHLQEDEFVLVYERAGQVEGFAAITRYSPRKCYDGVGLFSIYITRTQRGQGIGTRLLDEVIRTARQEGYRKIVLRALPFNERGIALYSKFGFERVGIHRKHGWLEDRWVDILVMELLL